ncbi:hypothetical protein GGS24DRAFT_516559 [Hypoxylon argillaceum]|nr:hypothetical protein GGS24DRAFT_516559 [Hypoxylon argillaceum]
MSITDPESLDYFIVPGDPLYAIVPAFQDWEFPHGRIPDSFPSLTVSQQPDEMKRHQQASRHPRCAVTNSAYSCQQAHLILKAYEAWFSKNAMIMALDQSNRMRGIDGSVIHVLQTSKDGAWDEFAQEYHNLWVLPQHLAHISRECLFARFALNVFILVKPFLPIAPLKRRVARLVIDPDRNSFITKISDVSSGELKDEYGSMSKNASPAKRKRATDEFSTQETQDAAVEDLWSPPCTEEDGRNSDTDTWYRDNVVHATEDGGASDKDAFADTWYKDNVVDTREENERGRSLKRVGGTIDQDDLCSGGDNGGDKRVKRHMHMPPSHRFIHRY